MQQGRRIREDRRKQKEYGDHPITGLIDNDLVVRVDPDIYAFKLFGLEEHLQKIKRKSGLPVIKPCRDRRCWRIEKHKQYRQKKKIKRYKSFHAVL